MLFAAELCERKILNLSSILTKILNFLTYIENSLSTRVINTNISDSIPGCRGTQGCQKEVLGCRQIMNYCLFIDVLLNWVQKIVIFYRVRPKGCREQKKVEKH
jgi:hypothetical protein